MRDLPYEEPLSMHAGLHAGVVLREAEQVYGDVVTVAARMARWIFCSGSPPSCRRRACTPDEAMRISA